MAKNRSKKILIRLIAIIILLLLLIKATPSLKSKFNRYKIEKINQATLELIQNDEIITQKIKKEPINLEIGKPETEVKDEEIIAKEEAIEKIPKEAYLEVQFICQAPLQTEENWTLHEESCEEAALLMTYQYETQQSSTKEEANEKILDMISWQEENLNGHFDLYADDLKEFAIGYLGISENEIQITYNANVVI